MTVTTDTLPIFDGHNDVLLHLYLLKRRDGRSFFVRSDQGHIDLPRAREGGFAGGFFAVFVPADPLLPTSAEPAITQTATGYEIQLAPPLDPAYAQRTAIAVTALLFRLEEESQGQVKVVRTTTASPASGQRCHLSHRFLAAPIREWDRPPR